MGLACFNGLCMDVLFFLVERKGNGMRKDKCFCVIRMRWSEMILGKGV